MKHQQRFQINNLKPFFIITGANLSFLLIFKLQMENGDIVEVYQEQIGGFI